MKKFNLQLFADMVQGKQIIYLFRVLSKAPSTDAVAMAFATENERSTSNEGDVIETKDGDVNIPKIKTEISATAILAVGDTLTDELETAMENGEKIEIWEANLAEKAGDKENQFKGRYFQGYLSEFTLSSSAEDHAEYECTFEVGDAGKKGNVTVTKAQQEAANYVFADTTKTGA